MQITRAEIIAVTLLIVAPQTDFTLNLNDESSGLSIAYRQRMSSDVAGHMRFDIAPVYFAKKRRCSEIASTHVVDERVKSAARCFRYIDFDVRVNLSGDRGKVFIQEGFAFGRFLLLRYTFYRA